MRELSIIRNPDEAMITMLVTFGNFFKFNNRSDHTWQSVSACLKSFGTVLSNITYFDFDQATPAQKRMMLNYSIATSQVTQRS